MFAPHPQPNQSSRKAPKEREALEETQWPGDFVEHDFAYDKRRQNAVVNQLLRSLNDPCRE